jgi:hypothetical protein
MGLGFGLPFGIEGVESAISEKVCWQLGSGAGTGATARGGRIADHCWDRLGTGMKASGTEPTGVGFAVATAVGSFIRIASCCYREYTT